MAWSSEVGSIHVIHVSPRECALWFGCSASSFPPCGSVLLCLQSFGRTFLPLKNHSGCSSSIRFHPELFKTPSGSIILPNPSHRFSAPTCPRAPTLFQTEGCGEGRNRGKTSYSCAQPSVPRVGTWTNFKCPKKMAHDPNNKIRYDDWAHCRVVGCTNRSTLGTDF